MPLVDAVTMSSALTTHAVALLDTPLAKSVAAGRPALLLGLFYLRFGSLVTNPVSTLQTALPVVAVIQAFYAVLCLPVAGSQAAKTSRKSRPGDKKRADGTAPNAIAVRLSAIP